MPYVLITGYSDAQLSEPELRRAPRLDKPVSSSRAHARGQECARRPRRTELQAVVRYPRRGSSALEAAAGERERLLQHREIADVIGEDQHQTGIERVALCLAQALVRADQAS